MARAFFARTISGGRRENSRIVSHEGRISLDRCFCPRRAFRHRLRFIDQVRLALSVPGADTQRSKGKKIGPLLLGALVRACTTVATVSFPDSIRVRPPGPLSARIRPPGSKSLSNRALLLAAMAEGRSAIDGLLDAEDTQLMRAALVQLGVTVHEVSPTHFEIEGHGLELGAQRSSEDALYVGTAGTAARFLCGALAGSHRTQPLTIDGSPRMRERPMAALFDALRVQGASLSCLEHDGFLPARLAPARLRGGSVVMERPASSQFVSALAIAALNAESSTHIVLRQGTPARPYVDMTLETIRHFGGKAQWSAPDTLSIEPSLLKAADYSVEPDASAASYFLAMAAIYGGSVEIPGLGRNSLQGDAGFHRVLERMGASTTQDDDCTRVEGGGALRGIDIDLSDLPDMTLTLAVAALFAEGPTRIRGVEILRHHESDRIAAGATELRKLGATVTEHPDGLEIHPPKGFSPKDTERDAEPRETIAIDTYEDHRMAMAFSLASHVTIRNPGCCAKTYPGYFDELHALGMVAG